MLREYRTVRKQAEVEIVIKKSRFIAHVRPVENEDQAVEFIESIKKENWSASHNCSAYVCGQRDEYQKQSDDGEPSGTAGKPILEVIKSQSVKNTVVVVTRYFGGIMLGAGGLIRAYAEAAAAGIAEAEPIIQILHREVWVELDYTWHGKVENELHQRRMLVGDTQFTDKVTLVCLPREEEADHFVSWITDLTQGQGVIIRKDMRYITHEIEE